MSSPASLSIILVTTSRLARADFDGSNSEPRAFWTVPRTAGTTMPDAVATALSLGGKAGRQVWVLCEEAWIQSLDLARGQISGLSDEQLARALSFEIEPFSGVAVANSALGFRETEDRNGLKTFWVVELTTAARQSIQLAVNAAGGRLAGICHPGGVPQSISAPEPGHAWRRLEAWSGNYVWLEADARGEIRTRVMTAPPVLPPPPAETTFEVLAAHPASVITTLDPAITWAQFSLDEEESLRRWLSGWAASVQRGQPALPVILPPAPKPTPRKFILTAVALEAVVLALCFVHWWLASAERDDLKKQQAAIASVNQQIQARTKENADLRKEVEDLEDQEQKRAQLAGRRGSMPTLLRALASTRPDDVVLSAIRPGAPGTLTVSGVALEALAVDEMSMVLTETLRPTGWTAQPLQKTAKGTLSNAGPWEFAISVTQENTSAPAMKRAR